MKLNLKVIRSYFRHLHKRNVLHHRLDMRHCLCRMHLSYLLKMPQCLELRALLSVLSLCTIYLHKLVVHVKRLSHNLIEIEIYMLVVYNN